MKQIIENSKDVTFKATCRKCGCKFTFTNEDKVEKTFPMSGTVRVSTFCPECNYEVYHTSF